MNELATLTEHPYWVLEIEADFTSSHDYHFDEAGYDAAKARALSILSAERIDGVNVAFAQLRPYGLNWDSGEVLMDRVAELSGPMTWRP